MKAKVIKIKDGLNGKGGKIGSLALIECNWCFIQKWIPASKIKYGYGKFCSKKCVSEFQKTQIMEKSNRWKGGKVKMLGYIWIKQKDGKYRKEHILKIESQIGRKLKNNECVHHLNGDKEDNRLCNLYLMTKSKHHKLHYKELDIGKDGRIKGKKLLLKKILIT